MPGNMRLKFKDKVIPPMKISKRYLKFKRKPRKTSRGISRLTRVRKRKFVKSRNLDSLSFQWLPFFLRVKVELRLLRPLPTLRVPRSMRKRS